MHGEAINKLVLIAAEIKPLAMLSCIVLSIYSLFRCLHPGIAEIKIIVFCTVGVNANKGVSISACCVLEFNDIVGCSHSRAHSLREKSRTE